MLGLLFLQFRSLTEALLVLVSVPFALVGSFWTLYLLGYPMSAPVWVGLLSVVGLAMQTGVVMVVYIDEAFHRRVRAGKIRSRDDIVEAHAEGTVRRLRPKIMTITTMLAALLPLLWADGRGRRDHAARGGADDRRPGDQRVPDARGAARAVHDLAHQPAATRAAAGRAGRGDRRRGAVLGAAVSERRPCRG